MKKLAVEWESYEMPSYGMNHSTDKTGIVGGLGVVTDEVLQRISGSVDITGIGASFLRGETLPTFEEIDGYKVIRPVYNATLSDAVKRCAGLFERAGIEFTGVHIRELPMLPFIRDYSLAIPEVKVSGSHDMICSHDWMSILGGYEKSREENTPLIVFLHSLESGRVGGMVHTPLGPREARPGGIFAGSRMIRDIEVLGLKESTVCFTVGTTMVEEVKLVGKSHGVPVKQIEKKLFPIHHGVDIKIFRPINGVEKEYDVLFIGRFAAVKGILELLDAIKMVKALVPDIRVKLIGGGELEPDIRRKIKRSYLEGNVTISTDWIQKEEKVLEINKAKMTIAPSKYEPHGQFDLESSSCGVPCITGTGGFIERVIPGVTGLSCNPFDAKDIAKKVHSLLSDENLREEMGRNARDFVVKNYSWDERAKVYPKIFEIVKSGDLTDLNDLPLTVDLQSTGFL
ncbi:glycogen synthase [archaeon BMS3Bbin16]|nr:glycogen synthase [archaeon BMS3Bbin16]